MSEPIKHYDQRCNKVATTAAPLDLMAACKRRGVVLRCESCHRALYGFMTDFDGKWVAVS